jgi:hypothetical protein
METLVLTGIFTEAMSDLLAALVATRGLTGATSRYAAVLAERTGPEVEQATAIGFFSGLGCGLLALLAEVLT